MKTISFILFALSTILSMFPIISKAQDVDFDIYPAEALKSCGILFMEPRTSQNPFYAPQITMACEKDDYYEMTASQYRILKSDMDSLGMQYISLEDAIRICKANPYWAENKIGTPIKQPERMPNNPHVDSTTIYIPFNIDELNHPVSFQQYILQELPAEDAPFVDITVPSQGHYFKILAKEEFWFKLEMRVHFRWGTVTEDCGYAAGPFTGYWKAPYNEHGYPYLIIDMIKPHAWPDIVRKLRNE